MNKSIRMSLIILLILLASTFSIAAKAKTPQKSAASKSATSLQAIGQDNADFNISNQTIYPVIISETGFISSNIKAAKSFVVEAPSQVIPPQKQISGYRIYQTSTIASATSVQYNMNFGYQTKMSNGKIVTLSTGQQIELFLGNGGMPRGYVVRNSQYVTASDKGGTLCPIQVSLNGLDKFENSKGNTGTAIFNIVVTNSLKNTSNT